MANQAHEVVLLIGHGTRDPRGQAEFHALTEEVRRLLPQQQVEACFLELAEPTIAQAVRRCAGTGVGRLVVVPVLLFEAGHAREDIPRALAEAAEPLGLQWRQTRSLGCAQPMLELSSRRFRSALAEVPGPTAAASDTLLLMVGRGSRDPQANAQMLRFTRLRWERDPTGWHETCFLAMTQPRLERALEMVARLPLPQIVVQPHLLFSGELLSAVQQSVEAARRKWPDKAWRLTAHLGPDRLVAQAVVENLPVVLAGDEDLGLDLTRPYG